MAQYTINYLTGDTDTVEADRVEYDIDARDYTFTAADGKGVVALAPIATVRSVIRQTGIEDAITRVRAEVARIRATTPTWDPVADLIEAALNGTPNTRKSTGRPTHPDGTPYNHGEIVAGGWEYCDGCRTWGQWTTEKAHDCISSHAMDTAADA